jgi:hypothetical protein
MLIMHPNPFYIPIAIYFLSVGVVHIVDVLISLIVYIAAVLYKGMTCLTSRR